RKRSEDAETIGQLKQQLMTAKKLLKDETIMLYPMTQANEMQSQTTGRRAVKGNEETRFGNYKRMIRVEFLRFGHGTRPVCICPDSGFGPGPGPGLDLGYQIVHKSFSLIHFFLTSNFGLTF